MMSQHDVQHIRDTITKAALDNAAFDGWSWDVVLQSAAEQDISTNQVAAVFPQRLLSVSMHVADLADRWMFETLKATDPEDHRIRDRICLAVLARYEALNPYKDAMSYIATYWSLPGRQSKAAKTLWRTADRIWDWAGDTATDYNRYTKRGLLSGILGATTLCWLSDNSEDMEDTKAFLDRRIDNVMVVGGTLGKVLGRFKSKVGS